TVSYIQYVLNVGRRQVVAVDGTGHGGSSSWSGTSGGIGSAGPVEKPGQPLVNDGGRDLVAALELAIPHPIAPAPQRWNQPAAAAVDRKDLVGNAVRDEDDGCAGWPSRNEKARREGQQVGEAVAVGP